MKKRLLFLIVFVSAHVCFSQAGKYGFRMKIGTVDSIGWYSIPLSEDIFKNTNRDFSDLRIYQFNQKDTIECPYLLKINQQEVTEEVFHPWVINQTKKDGSQYFTLQLPKSTEVNFISLAFNETNFDGAITLEGSNDQKEWFEIINKNRIISIVNENINFYSASIHFSPQSFSFIRAKIKADKTLTLKEATLKRETIKPALLNESKLKWTTEIDKKEKQSVVNIELNQFQPVVKLQVDVNDKIDYYRPFQLERLNDSTKTPKGWQYFYETIFEGYLTSLDSNQFVFDYAEAKKMRLVINDGDNAALAIKSISIFSPKIELIARMNTGESYLYFGNKNDQLPNYDIVNFKNKIPATVPTLALSSTESFLVTETPVSPLIQNKVWLWVFMGIVIAVLGFFTLRMMKEK